MCLADRTVDATVGFFFLTARGAQLHHVPVGVIAVVTTSGYCAASVRHISGRHLVQTDGSERPDSGEAPQSAMAAIACRITGRPTAGVTVKYETCPSSLLGPYTALDPDGPTSCSTRGDPRRFRFFLLMLQWTDLFD